MTPPVPPVAPAAPAVITGAQLNVRIAHGDPQFPKELWGKTLAEAMRFYSIMREDFMRRNDPGQPPAGNAAAPPAAPAAPQRPAYTPPAAPPAPGAGGTFDEAAVQRMITQAVSAAFASSPLAKQAADTTYDRMKREYSDWMSYDSEILEALDGATAEQLANPETWRTAYFWVKGKKLSEGGQPAAAPAPAGQPTVFGQPIVTRPPTPPNNENTTWFTEGPTAPPATTAGALDPRNDPRNITMAARHGLPIDEYVQWLNGQVPGMSAPARS